MINTNDAVDALMTTSHQHPITYLILLTVWVMLTFWIWRQIVAAVFGNSGDKLTDIERTRLNAYEMMARHGIAKLPEGTKTGQGKAE